MTALMISVGISVLMSFLRKQESSKTKSAFSGTLFDWIPGHARYDVILLSFRNLEHLLTPCQKADIIHAETKSDMYGFMSISRIQAPQMAGFRLFSEVPVRHITHSGLF